MSRARVEGDTLVFDDPVRNKRVEVYLNEGDIAIDDGERAFWMRRSDAGVVAEWLAKNGGDWRSEP